MREGGGAGSSGGVGWWLPGVKGAALLQTVGDVGAFTVSRTVNAM